MAARGVGVEELIVVLSKLLAAGLLLLSTALAFAEAPPLRMVITVDDLPWSESGRTSDKDLQARHDKLITALKGTHAIGFVNEDKLYLDGELSPARKQMLADWLDAGLDLGNHTYGHVGLHQTPIEQYEKAILDGERVTRALLAELGRTPRYFRHPFLHGGRTQAVRERLAGFLKAHGYEIAPVTIDNGEWIYARAYLNLLGEKKLERAAEIKTSYLAYMDRKIAFFERTSQDLLGYQLPQVLLLHANALNADALPELLKAIEKRGYKLITLEEALRDPAYQMEDGHFGPGGITWLHRWAMAKKMPKSFYAGEPEVPRDVLELAGVDEE